LSDIAITEKLLLNAGGWQAMKPARELLKTGRSRFVIRANQLSRNLPPCALLLYVIHVYVRIVRNLKCHDGRGATTKSAGQ